MKGKTSLLASLILVVAFALTGYAANVDLHGERLAKIHSIHSADYHVETIRHLEEYAAWVEGKIQKLEELISTINHKPYRDPKGFRRTRWKSLIGTWKQEVRGLQEGIASHTQEMARLQAQMEERDRVDEEASQDA